MNDILSHPDPSADKDPEGNGDAMTAALPARSGRERLFKLVPALDSLRNYSFASFRFDLLAGLTVAAVAVPQAMALAMVAGLDPKYGLYTAIVMTAVGALFDSSRQLINGPTNAIAIALLSALAPVADQDKLQAAVLLALLVGLIQTGITLLRLGDLSRYISHSVIVGFTAGAGLLLVLDQLKNLLGIPGQGDVHDPFLVRLWITFSRAAGVNAWSAAIGFGSIGLIFALRWLKGRSRLALLPEFLLTVIIMAGLVWLFDLERQGVNVVGHVPRTLPSLQLPEVQWGQVRLLANSALAIGVLGLLEAIAMAKAIAAQTGQKLDINQQCLSEGLANLSGSLFQCFPGSGSLTRSTINQQAGAVTQWSGVISAGAVAAIVLLFGDLASYIPRAALAGILILSAFQIVNRHQLLYHWQATRFDRWIVLATAVAAFAINVEYCMLIGVLMSFVFYVPRAGRLHMTELVVTPERVVRERGAGDPRCDRIRIYSMEGELFFGSAPDLEKHLEAIAKHADDGIRVLVLSLKHVRNPDAVCIQLIDLFLVGMNARKVPVLLCGIRPEMARVMRRTGLTSRLGVHQIFAEDEAGGAYSSTLQAVRHAYDLLNGDVCAICPRRAEESKKPLYYMI